LLLSPHVLLLLLELVLLDWLSRVLGSEDLQGWLPCM
jgi:hypothetical protein